MPSVFRDSPEYIRRIQTPFKPPQVTLAEVRAAVPKYLFKKSTPRGLLFVVRDITQVLVFYELACRIEPFVKANQASALASSVPRPILWSAYWLLQSLALSGCWCLAHEAGHGTLVSISWLNHLLGFVLHTALLVPYYAWRSTHHAHHKATGSLERDENYIPKTRSQYGLPAEQLTRLADYHEVFEEAPMYTLLRMIAMQMVGWQWYLLTNIMGNPSYPPGTNHFKPSSTLFKPRERTKIIASNVGLGVMIFLLSVWTKHVGFANFFRLYFVPYLLTNHWIVMITFLQHSDPTLPHYRGKSWSFMRGAIATVDRPFLGWIGRSFLHNVSHDHVAHHLFSDIPFYNQPYATRAIKSVLKDDYNYDSTGSFRALYRSFSQCCFIEDDGEVVFYRNKDGKARQVFGCDDVESEDKTC